jgi:hypothetical protein
MGLINWVFDIYQHSKIDEVRREAAAARAEVAAVRNRSGGVESERLVRALGELALATKTIQRMMIEKGVCTHTEFDSRLREIDREDGDADGRVPI